MRKDCLPLDVSVQSRATFAAEDFLVLGQEAFPHQGDRALSTVKAFAVPLAVLKADKLGTSETCKGIGGKEYSFNEETKHSTRYPPCNCREQ